MKFVDCARPMISDFSCKKCFSDRGYAMISQTTVCAFLFRFEVMSSTDLPHPISDAWISQMRTRTRGLPLPRPHDPAQMNAHDVVAAQGFWALSSQWSSCQQHPRRRMPTVMWWKTRHHRRRHPVMCIGCGRCCHHSQLPPH